MKHTALFIAFALAACSAVSPSPALTGTPTAALNQTASIGFWRIKPIAVIEDSRCPKNVQCVWAGRLILRTLTDAGAGADIKDFTLGEPLKMGNVGYLTLVDVQPPKLAPGTTDPRQYRFKFALERTP